MGHVFPAVFTATTGGVLALLGVLAQAAEGTDLGPWISGGGAAAAVGGLVYVAKLLASGQLVAYPVADLTRRAEERERTLADLLEDSKEREDSLRLMIVEQRRRQ